ncbi:FAD-dependent oxidoreductase [Thalassotalea euphylliae]|uniref:FAD-dependent oxidoreductase n=1 Tax=Thalassotalea euphylliae TaxID=1655234 RepID=A0A3E0TR03_9GAMM|nr:FAD-dependent oxidoreductase [Thalassotalea euphylliae]REL26883.1 FAD-dependent oxidoreductase [Thalassotalea euphylliae]
MKRIAVIGSGIAGLTSAYLLSKKHQVTVFEQNDYIGGHTATIDIDYQGEQLAIDTGFIVFNNKTYPLFLQLLEEIGVGRQETEMSFSVHNLQTGFEYNGHNLNTLFAQRRNIVRPRFWHLISEILRFNRHCKALHGAGLDDNGQTLGQFLNEHNYSRFFCEHYILPMGAAIWSSSVAEMEAFELKFFIRFFHNHGLLNIADRPQWYVIPGGSKQYIAPLTKSFANDIQLNAELIAVTRQENSVTLRFTSGSEQVFDEVVFACHSDQALALLGDASSEEKQVLGDIPYQANSVVLHTDKALLPKRKKAWASWNYQLTTNRNRPASVTYNMNILQGLNAKHTYCVTLNQEEDINPEHIIKKFEYHHPVFNLTSMAAQQKRALICGQRNTHFVGAYWYNGFHEDGVRSANDVAERFGCELQSSEQLSKQYG